MAGEELPLLRRQLEGWRMALRRHQAPLFAAGADRSVDQPLQGALFETGCTARTQAAEGIHPLQLRAQPLSFWRWPDPPQRGAALYFVLDSVPVGTAHDPQPVLLYVGETGRADRRWKAEHDCKHYLAAYSEALARAGLASRLNIRFWLDAPSGSRERRALEQALIRRWLPPFNKETRQRWGTPFTAEPD
ncbi:GIY-YIG nuclease family protein [Cyanobium sp. CH-040]|uniref:GIY-YIG nuclease family protein n=1 Tax=Cyanobium sp. CH-040 TaxID=2823708 RepID=UPI0020CD3EAC|nr:GIY-YIG nuclease family protein [Cyanobium sp. CH-040]MCP9928928.1 GIY-YIG nuclease family protein [Cyanobium sp. CH-040]